MAEKIILFLSDLKPNARPASYTFQGEPDTETVSGTQTNEAPVKRSLRKHPGISQVICFCSTKSQNPVTLTLPNGTARTADQSALEHFSEHIEAFSTDNPVQLVPLDYNPSKSLEQDLLPDLMKHITSNDSIYLDLTGGMRNDNLNLFLLSRVLNYTGVVVKGAVYSNFETKQVEDMTHLIHTFDLVEGVQDFTSFGNVKKLRAYYGEPAKDADVEKLLKSMETLIQNITLCRSTTIDSNLKTFSKALNKAKHCGDPLLEQLLPAFRQKYCKGTEENTMTTPELIAWCLDSDMVQQALTLYTERIPAYLREMKYLTIGTLEEKAQEKVDRAVKDSHQDETTVIFDKDLLLRGFSLSLPTYSKVPYVKTIERLVDALKETPYRLNVPTEQMQHILRDYIYLKMVRNMINHANDHNAEGRRSQEAYLVKYGYPPIDKISVADIRKTLTTALQRLTDA